MWSRRLRWRRRKRYCLACMDSRDWRSRCKRRNKLLAVWVIIIVVVSHNESLFKDISRHCRGVDIRRSRRWDWLGLKTGQWVIPTRWVIIRWIIIRWVIIRLHYFSFPRLRTHVTRVIRPTRPSCRPVGPRLRYAPDFIIPNIWVIMYESYCMSHNAWVIFFLIFQSLRSRMRIRIRLPVFLVY